MARGINKVILIGNLGRDPETRYTQSGSPVANLRIATSEGWRDRQTNEMQERTEWHSVVCFARLAEVAGEYLRKGSKVYIEGRLQTSSWEQDGQTRYKTEIVARDLQMLDSRGGGGGQDGYRPARQDSYQSGGADAGGPGPLPSRRNEPTVVDGADDDLEDDIPF